MIVRKMVNQNILEMEKNTLSKGEKMIQIEEVLKMSNTLTLKKRNVEYVPRLEIWRKCSDSDEKYTTEVMRTTGPLPIEKQSACATTQ